MISIEDCKLIFQIVKEARVVIEREIAEDRRGFFNALTAVEAMETTVRNRLIAAINIVASEYDE